MAGTYKPIEVGVCEQGSIPDRGTWCFRIVTVPALTPPEVLEQMGKIITDFKKTVTI